MGERITRDGGMRQASPIEAGPLVAYHDFQATLVHAIGNADQAIRLVKVAPLNRIMGHLHDGLTKLDHLVASERGRLAHQHRKVVQVLEEIDFAVDLDVNFAV